MSDTKQFPLRVLLTVTTGRLLTKSQGERNNGIGDLYELLGWMTNDQPFTHQLPRFGDECKPWLLRWFPALALADDKLAMLDETIKLLGPEKGVEAWLGGFSHIMPTAFDVPRIPQDDHEKQNPITEAEAMFGADKVIVVNAGATNV